MIYHIVLLQVASHVSENNIRIAIENLGALRYHDIPEILSFSYGKNASPEDLHRNYNFGFTMTFANEDDRDAYLAHPEHIRIAKEQILPLLVDGVNSALAFDYSY